jgi:predicted Rossmann-fold nucleotide-binding protein
MAAARALASVFASQNIKLVYGGGTVGLMGEVARSLVALSGPDSVHGIIPAPLMKYERGPDSRDDEVREGGDLPEPEIYGRTTVVKDMHTRKQMMVCFCSLFFAYPPFFISFFELYTRGLRIGNILT